MTDHRSPCLAGSFSTTAYQIPGVPQKYGGFPGITLVSQLFCIVSGKSLVLPQPYDKIEKGRFYYEKKAH